MSTAVEQVFATPQGKYLVDPYDDWARAEGVPIHAGAAIDLLSVDAKPWARFGVDGAICHLDGRDDFLTIFVYDLAPGAASAPMRHLHEEVCYGLAGHGVAEIDLPGGGVKSIEWGPKTLFSAPMNATMRIRNTSGERARVASVTDFRYLISLYRNENFLFNTPLDFPERASGDYAIDCAMAAAGPMTRPNEAALPISLANGSIGVDIVAIAAGKYGRAERQMFGSLVIGVDGDGMTLSRAAETAEFTTTRWRHGIAHAPAGMMFHQHFNVGARPARFLRVELGGLAAPMFRPRRKAYGDASVYAAGSATIDTSEQSPLVERLWRESMSPR